MEPPSVTGCRVRVSKPGHSECGVDLVESSGIGAVKVFMGYSKALVTVRHPPSLPPSRNADATTVPVLLATLLTRTQGSGLRSRDLYSSLVGTASGMLSDSSRATV